MDSLELSNKDLHYLARNSWVVKIRITLVKTQVEQKVKYYFYCEVVFCEKVKVVRAPEMSRVNLTCCLTDCSNNKYLQFFVILQSEGGIP